MTLRKIQKVIEKTREIVENDNRWIADRKQSVGFYWELFDEFLPYGFKYIENSNRYKIDSPEVKTIYNEYPPRCKIKQRSLGKCFKNKSQIIKLLSDQSPERILRTQYAYVKDCVENEVVFKNYTTFLNNFPVLEDFKPSGDEPGIEGVVI